MAKKMTEPVRRVHIASPYFEGYLDEMPQAAKEKMKAENAKLHKQLFEATIPIVEPTIPIV